MRVRNIAPVLAILTLGMCAALYLWVTQPEKIPLVATEQVTVVAVIPVQKQSLAPMGLLYGQVESQRSSTLSAAVEADVVEVMVSEGNDVSLGQPLVRLDDTDTRLLVIQSQAEVDDIAAQINSDQEKLESDLIMLTREKTLLALSRKALERTQRLAKTLAGAEAGVDEAKQNEQRQSLAVSQREQIIKDYASRRIQLEARLRKAQAGYEKAVKDLERTNITAPFYGRVTAVLISPGDRISRGMAVLKLYDLDSVEIRTLVPDRFVGTFFDALDSGQTVMAALSGHGLQLQLDRFAGEVKKNQGGVEAFFKPLSGAVPPLGQAVSLDVTLPLTTEVVALPATALYGGQRVYRIDDHRLQGITVTLIGERRDESGQQQILVRSDDLRNGDYLLTSRLPQAIDGLRVKFSP